MISPELLRRFSLFGGMPPEMFEEIALFCEEHTFEPDTYLFEQGEAATAVYLVLDGMVDLLIDMDEEGELRDTIETIVAGEMLGWSAMVEPYRYKLSAATTTRAQIIQLDARRLNAFLNEHPHWGLILMKRVAQTIGERLTNMRTRLMSIST